MHLAFPSQESQDVATDVARTGTCTTSNSNEPWAQSPARGYTCPMLIAGTDTWAPATSAHIPPADGWIQIVLDQSYSIESVTVKQCSSHTSQNFKIEYRVPGQESYHLLTQYTGSGVAQHQIYDIPDPVLADAVKLSVTGAVIGNDWMRVTAVEIMGKPPGGLRCSLTHDWATVL